MHKKSRQQEAMNLHRHGFSQKEISEMLSINQSTVSRYFRNPTRAEAEDFRENWAYGSYITESGEKVPFNRRYKPLKDKKRWVEDIERTEYYYNDGTCWEERFYNSAEKYSIYPVHNSIDKTPLKE